MSEFVPGTRVMHPTRSDWGLGEVQSAVGNRVTVNFEHAGKVLVRIDQVDLEVISDQNIDAASYR